jgi:hypothetical protein
MIKDNIRRDYYTNAASKASGNVGPVVPQRRPDQQVKQRGALSNAMSEFEAKKGISYGWTGKGTTDEWDRQQRSGEWMSSPKSYSAYALPWDEIAKDAQIQTASLGGGGGDESEQAEEAMRASFTGPSGAEMMRGDPSNFDQGGYPLLGSGTWDHPSAVLKESRDPYMGGEGITYAGPNQGTAFESTINSYDQAKARQDYGRANYGSSAIVDAWDTARQPSDAIAQRQPGDMVFSGGSQEISEGGKVTGWIKDAASGEYVGTRPDGSTYRSKTKPAITDRGERASSEPQSQADLLNDYNHSVTKSIDGYYNQSRANLDREFQASYPRWVTPGPKELGLSTKQYELMYRDSQIAGGTRPSALSALWDQYNAQYQETLGNWEKSKFEAITAMENARDKAHMTAEQQAMARNYNLEKQLIAARNKMADPYAVRDRAGKAIDSAKRLAENSPFINPTATFWQSRSGELTGAQKGRERNKYIVDETAMPPGTSPEYINMARQASDLLNTYYSGTSTYEQVNNKALGFERASIGYEQAALRKHQGTMNDQAKREATFNESDTPAQREAKEAGSKLPTDSGKMLFSGGKQEASAREAAIKASPPSGTPKAATPSGGGTGGAPTAKTNKKSSGGSKKGGKGKSGGKKKKKKQ